MRWNFFPIFDVLVWLKQLFSTPPNAALINLTVYGRELTCAGLGRKQLRRHDGEEEWREEDEIAEFFKAHEHLLNRDASLILNAHFQTHAPDRKDSSLD
jgi:hypothetical protein